MIHKTLVPIDRKVTVSFTVPESYVGEEVEVIAFIKKDNAAKSSPSLPGDPLSDKDFKNWIAESEKMTVISLESARNKWINQRRKLEKSIQ